MRMLTISIADEVYQRASQKAAAAAASLPEVVQELLAEWTQENQSPIAVRAEIQRRADFLKFLDELEARPLQSGPSVGPLNREELHQRGISGY